jgi:tellurite resistance protein
MSYSYSTPHATPAFHDAVPLGGPHSDCLVDAMIAAGALAAWADGSVRPVERMEMVVYMVYMRRSGLSSLGRRDVLGIFDQRVRALEHDSASAKRATLDLLSDFSGSSLAWTVLRAAEHVAAADSRVLGSELMVIRAIRAALGMSSDRFTEPRSA